MSLGVYVCVCVRSAEARLHAALVSAAKVMRCIQCSLVLCLSLVYHSCRGKFKTYWLKMPEFTYVLLTVLKCNAFYCSYCVVILDPEGRYQQESPAVADKPARRL